MIEVKHLSKVYNKGKDNEVRAVDDVSIRLENTGFYVIFGKSGAGKSSLMNALGGLNGYTDGTITYDNEEFKKMVPDSCRVASIAYIFQNYCLDTSANVYDNVAIGLRSIGITDEEVIFTRTMTALENVGMTKYYKRNVATLSGGQQQRVAIARAMAKGSKIILADEPTGNLDEQNTKIVMDLLKELSKTRMVIVVTHETSIAHHYADRIIEISNGRVVSDNMGSGMHVEGDNSSRVYLGDMEHSSTTLGGITLNSYGDNKVNIDVVSVDGNTYLRVNNSNVKLLDEKSAVELVDMTREEFMEREKKEVSLHIKELALVEPKKTGAVFTFKDSYNGGRNVSRKAHKRERFLKISMCVLVVCILLISALWGASFNNYNKIKPMRSAPIVSFSFEKKNYEPISKVLSKYDNDIIDNRIKAKYDVNQATIAAIAAIGFVSNVGGGIDKNAQVSMPVRVVSKDRMRGSLTHGVVGNDSQCVVTSGFIKSDLERRKWMSNSVHYSYEEYAKMMLGASVNIDGMTNVYSLNITGIIDENVDGIYVSESAMLSSLSASNLDLIKSIEPNELIKDDVVYAVSSAIVAPTLSVYKNGNKVTVEYVELNSYMEKVLENIRDSGIADVDKKLEETIGYFDSIDDDSLLIMTPKTAAKLGRDAVMGIHVGDGISEMTMQLFVDDKTTRESIFKELDALTLASGDKAVTSSNIGTLDDYLTHELYDKDYAREPLIRRTIIVAVLYVMLVIVAVLVTFANFMERTKEVGIYRAIGVSKANIVYKYFVESLRNVIFLALGILVVIGSIMALCSYFPLDATNELLNGSVFYLSFWQLAVNIVVLVPLLMLISILPVLRYMKKSPIEILAEYDI